MKTPTGKRRVYSGKYALSNVVYCAHCGDFFQRTHYVNRGKKKIVWRCVSRLHKKDSEIECPARTISEATLQMVVVETINEVFANRELVLPELKANVSKALETNNSKKIAGIDKLLEDLQVELLKKAQAKQPFDDITEQIESLRRQKREMQLEDANRQAGVTHVCEMDTFLDELDTKVTEYDEALVRRFIERITVYDKHCKVTFKSGAEINIKM